MNFINRSITFFSGIVLLVCCSQLNAQEPVDFNTQIRPILNTHCISCHGPDEQDRYADLRLDTYDGATESAIEPGDAEGSEAFDRITTDDEDLRMPPAEHGDALSPEEAGLIRQWIDEGAKYSQHWSFVSIEKPAVPQIENADKLRIHNDIDSFILKRIQAAGLSQNGPSRPRQLVRRVALDLTGIPPQFHQQKVQDAIQAYLQDNDQANFSTLVDRLLESPAYAEHWASVWLDLARYADTCGYSGDEKRDIWPWRDWLIRSLRDNKSYKDMSIEMLAGDMLENATRDQVLATAFHRNTLSNNEGGTNDEEFRTIAVKDRLSTTMNAWMGLTVRCAECHTHKYDPISQIEYYQLLDFFNHTVDADNRDDRPKLEVKPSQDPAVTKEFNDKIAALRAKRDAQPKVWNVLQPADMKSRNGTEFELLPDDSILATGPLPGIEEYSFTFEAAAGTTFNAIKLETLPHVRHNGNVGRAPEGAFLLSQIRIAEVPGEGKEKLLDWKSATSSYHQKNRHAKKAIRKVAKPQEDKGWGVKHPVNGYRVHQEAIFELKKPFTATQDTRFKIYLLFDPPWKRLTMGCVRISSCETKDAVAKYNKKELDQLNREFAALIEKRDAPIRVPVIRERTEKRETFVNIRGNFQSKGEKVTAQFPEAFAGEKEFSLNRLGLAHWMFDNDNPLTARVAANRYWARMMGIGLVETEEDFGTQGTPPSHPQLLDFLATRFRESGWDSRELLKSIVMSATYQQSQHAQRDALKADPRNRLLARGPRVRLSAEVVRDQALAVSGLLSRKMYGQPVYPPNPVKRVVNAFTGGLVWQESTGEDRYRRAIYTFLKRSAPHPLFETFDVSTRDVCQMRRLRTNTPLQSFMTLNDVTFIEAARALGDGMLQSRSESLEEQISFGIQQALFVPATEIQTRVLAKVYNNNVARFAADPASAAKLLGMKSAEVESMDSAAKSKAASRAAMTLVGNVILNLDSFLNN